MLDLTSAEIQFTLHAVRQAARLVQQVQKQMVSPALTKDDRSPVTVADFTAQALVGWLLAQNFPNDLMVAEEASSGLRAPEASEILRQVTQFASLFAPGSTPEQACAWIDYGRADTGARFWTLDPIDGTKGFLRRDQYAVALALVESGQVKIGALGCPNLTQAIRPDHNGPGSVIIAVRGQGAWSTPLHGEGQWLRLQVSAESSPEAARVLRSFESGHTNVDQIDQFTQAMGSQAEPVRMDSQAKYAVLAAGGGEVLLRLLSASQPEYKEKIWDQAAGSLVLEEAGGRITDLDGKPLDFTTRRMLMENRGILATNGRMHPAALNALRRVGA